ncbi:uncharacterized protein MYCFIDRAFT_88541 [Pseudocercospora fijiensis CIRAD86]|uniref:Major facilitator superfamily (MFS) profile domain-containing protein n=1 Tax=Pseudocercospora fijiensis (strain CIRAD86) TaxID=383855 RepID=M2Z6U9_PSEFD|nr:uncharacterized protein MYCFIDRAFT_88541 [Pseudocercospora fijiensis CIRAD86]EME85510.1 hypothetical protein MYCFIDRAFT_88541 [Pseudocercospora fijiensis CIRAD86]
MGDPGPSSSRWHCGVRYERISNDDGADAKQATEYLDEIDGVQNADKPKRGLEAPGLVRNLTAEERTKLEKKLVRKIDLRLLPPVIIMYIMNYLDRNNIATARLAGTPGLEEDLKMTDSQYETCVSILFVGYILMQIPSNLFLNKVGKPALYLPGVMVVWGIISTVTAAAHNFAGLVVIRFFLGFVEAAYFPGCLFFLSCWYTRKELAFRSAVLYSGSLISGAFAGLIAAGITDGMDRKLGLPAWKWLFIIEGAVTIVIAIVCFFILPNFPRTTTWLTEEERQLAVWRLQEDIGVDDWVNSEEQSFWHGMFLAFKDIKVWILMVMLLGIVSAASVTNFFPTVVQTLGYSNIISLLLTAPPYVLAVFTAFANAIHADKTGERFLHITIPLLVGMVSFILAAATTSTAPRYLAMMLMVPGIYTGYVIVLAWISNTIPRPPAKRAAALAAINAVSNASSIYASYMYSGGPRFIVAFSVNCGTLFLAILMAALLRVTLVRLNKKLDRGEEVEGAISGASVGEGAAMRKGFRFLV